MDNFDPDFDLAAFKAKNSDLVAADTRLRELCQAAREHMRLPDYAEARKSLGVAEKGVAAFTSEVIAAGGHEKWRKKVGNAAAKAEREATRHFDAYDKAREVVELPQGALQAHVDVLRADESRARWVAENPAAYAKEQAALQVAREEHLHAQAKHVARLHGAPDVPEDVEPEPEPEPEPEAPEIRFIGHLGRESATVPEPPDERGNRATVADAVLERAELDISDVDD